MTVSAKRMTHPPSQSFRNGSYNQHSEKEVLAKKLTEGVRHAQLAPIKEQFGTMLKASAVLCAVVSSLSLSAFAQSKLPAVTVRGEAQVTVKPDYSRISVAVVTLGRDASEATAAHQERATRASREIRNFSESGLTIERSWFRLGQDRRTYSPTDGTEKGSSGDSFAASTTYELKLTKIELLDEIITRLGTTGLFEVHSSSFEADNPHLAANRAREAAFLNARMQAEAYASVANVRLAEVIAIVDNEARQAPVPMAEIRASDSVQIIPPPEIAFSAAVSVTWHIVPRE